MLYTEAQKKIKSTQDALHFPLDACHCDNDDLATIYWETSTKPQYNKGFA